MAVTAARVTVGTSAVALNTATTGGQTLRVKNGLAVIALGPSTITTANGYEVAANAVEPAIELEPGEVLFAVSGSTSNVQVLQT